MIDWLYTLPDWLLLVLWAAALAGLIVLLPVLTHRIPWLRPNAENSDFVLRLQATLFTVTSFVVFKYVVKLISSAHGLRATFMPKPYITEAGNGLHIHQSLLGPDG